MPDHDRRAAQVLEDARDPSGGLALAAARAHGTDGDHGDARLDHCRARPEEAEIGAQRDDARRLLHHVLVRNVGIGEDGFVDLLLGEELFQAGLRDDGDPLRIELSRQVRRVAAPGDVGNLRRRECRHAHARIVAKDAIEVVEIPPRGAHDDDAPFLHDGPSLLQRREPTQPLRRAPGSSAVALSAPSRQVSKTRTPPCPPRGGTTGHGGRGSCG